MVKFFISYTKIDQSWAEWIAWQLERAGYSTVLQAWDFQAGSNFILEVQSAISTSDSTIAVLSHEYLKKVYPTTEWTTAFAQDPTGIEKRLIPIRISNVDPPGLLSTIVYIDLVDIDTEQRAINTLLEGISSRRKKPIEPPSFPRINNIDNKLSFPGEKNDQDQHAIEASIKVQVEIKINRTSITDFEKKKFLHTIRDLLDLSDDPSILETRIGSVYITIELSLKDALYLYILHHISKLRQHRVEKIQIKGYDFLNIDDVLATSLALEPHPPIKEEKEKGTIVYIDREQNYGIIKRNAGGFIKCNIPRSYRIPDEDNVLVEYPNKGDDNPKNA